MYEKLFKNKIMPRIYLLPSLNETDHGTRYPTIAITTSTFVSTTALYDFFLLSASSPSDLVSLFLLVLLFLLAFLARSFSLSLVVLPLSSSLSSAGRRRPDERDNSSSIRLLSAATLFSLLSITPFFILICPSRRLWRVIGEGGASAHCSFNQERCTRKTRQLVVR